MIILNRLFSVILIIQIVVLLVQFYKVLLNKLMPKFHGPRCDVLFDQAVLNITALGL